MEYGSCGPGYLEIKAGKFGDFYHSKPEVGVEVIDYSGHFVAPGLVDTHIHGFRDKDVMDNNFDGLNIISEELLTCGVTSFLPTTLTSPTEQLNEVCQLIGQRYRDVQGAKIKGIFLEGPIFTEKHKGAQNASYFDSPSISKLKKWNELANGLVRKIAVAPEKDGIEKFIQYAKSENIFVALAHSDATYEQAKRAVEIGASIFVHTFNGMRGLHHREPGMVGAALSLKDVFAELICDGHHVHPVAAQILVQARGVKETVLVSDCMRAGGMEEGVYTLGDYAVKVKDGTARLGNNSLAGSILQLKDAVKNVVAWGIASLEDAIYMASTGPAKSVQIDDECGKISRGYPADFIILNQDMDLMATYLDGTCHYQKC